MNAGQIQNTANGLSIWSWYPLMVPVWRYLVICPHMELAYMQGVKARDVHVICVMDDFGNLVRVPT